MACAVLGITTELFLRQFLLSQLDTQLGAAGGRYSASLEHGSDQTDPSADAATAIPGQSVGTLGIRLIDGRVSQAAVVTEAGTNRAVTLDTANTALIREVPVGGPPRTVDLAGIGDYRVQTVRGHDGDLQVTGLPLHPMNETLARLFLVDATLFAALVLAGAIATTLMVRRALRPLEQLSATALQVSELALTGPETSLPSTATTRSGSEVDQVSASFDQMLGRVSHAMAERDVTEERLRRFIADASHELRTPIATIRAYAEYGAAPSQGEIPPETAEALGRITAASERMGSLVADLLLLARLDAGRPLARETVDLTKLVLDAVADAKTASPDHYWRLDLPEDAVTVTGDGGRLHQVLSNLLTNARTHTPRGTMIVTRLVQGPSTVDLTVSDDGPGIPLAQQPSLFDRFSRGDTSRSRAHGSTGLGLAIAHSIVAAHGGTLTVQSTPASGASLRVQLPVTPPRLADGSR